MNRRIRVLQVIYNFDIEGGGGGVSRFAVALSHALNHDQFDVAVCGLWNMGSQAERTHIHQLNSQGIKAFAAAEWENTKPMRSLWKSYTGTRKFLQKSPYDVIHSHSEFSDIVSIMLKLNPTAPIILRTLHNGYPIEWRKRYLRRLLFSNILYPLCFNAEIGVSNHVVSNLNRRWLSQRLKHEAKLIYNAVDLHRFNSMHHENDKTNLGLGIPRAAFLIGAIGRLREEKGFDILLDAAQRVIRHYPNTYFIIIGSGELEGSLKAQAINLQIDEHLIFTGSRSDVEFLLSGMDLFVCSSLWEGLSTTVLEAMAAGVPVLATDIPGNRELIKEGINGWMVPARDIAALELGIIKILNLSDQQRQQVIFHARQDVMEYSMDAIADQHSRFYHQLIAHKSLEFKS